MKRTVLSSRVPTGLVRFDTAVNRREWDKDLQRLQEPPVRKIGQLQRSRSLHRAGKQHGRKQGEIIKMDTMLVRVETTQTKLSADYDENESAKVITRVADKWREHLVVCREGYEEGSPMVLNLYKSRSIPAVERPKVSKRSHREILLDVRTTKVNIYSSLDKTLVLWLPHRYGTVIYIMRPRCSSASVEWYTFLRDALGEPRLSTLQIAVPDLSLTLQIDNPFEKLDKKMELECESPEKDDVYLKEERAVASNLLHISMAMLEGIPEWADIVDHWRKNERMGLAWRRYDRLEWVHGANEQRMHGSFAMERTHDLELRPKTHYPTETKISSGETMTEPPPVEGFLMRLTSGLGRQQRLGKVFQKCLYFSTHDNLLCFCRPGRADPPVHPSLWKKNGEMAVDEPTAREIAMLPIIWSITPYPVNEEGEIEWLHSGDQEVVDTKDRMAYDEAQRRVNTLLVTEGIIDLCNVEEVLAAANAPHGVDLMNSFELKLNNGLTLRLQACNQKTRDEWILRLTSLVKYWKSRTLSDLAIIRRVRTSNLTQLRVDEEMESLLGQYARKWEVSRTIASPDLYNVCGISSCRAITMSGVLYRKPRRRSTFRRTNVVLCHGELLVFANTARDRSGKAIPTVYQERVHALDLKNCYIYSGVVTASDLLYQNQTFDSNSPGRHALPRIYADGYTSRDEDEMTCFVVWHGKRSTVVMQDADGRQVRRPTTKLGTLGRAQVFKARSRLERDTWVMSIAMEIERLNAGTGKEVKVEEPKRGGRLKEEDVEEE
ncbi:hypothetical protein EX30DRAFT_309876 [Ascodesmis nigricans]|uniref:PH domain-containing protein n=1 Tax=Ascodesmis nigricans TaxID=341454 RepID=A0A4S2MN39_9PEZI|nr:hypothetical protein EX30DRAFT_309876 [Ascodesmis nigricans]